MWTTPIDYNTQRAWASLPANGAMLSSALFSYSKASFSHGLHKIDSRPLLDGKDIVWIVDLPFFSFQEVHYQNSKLIPETTVYSEKADQTRHHKETTCCEEFLLGT